jgi:hypothetical protein
MFHGDYPVAGDDYEARRRLDKIEKISIEAGLMEPPPPPKELTPEDGPIYWFAQAMKQAQTVAADPTKFPARYMPYPGPTSAGGVGDV